MCICNVVCITLKALEFLKFVQQLLAGSQESTVNEVVKLEIRKWLEILVNSIDMKNDNVAVLLTVLQSEDFQNQKPYVNNCVSVVLHADFCWRLILNL